MSWWRETGEDREGGFEVWRGEVEGGRWREQDDGVKA